MFSVGLLGSPDTQCAAVKIHLCSMMVIMVMIMVKMLILMMIEDQVIKL